MKVILLGLLATVALELVPDGRRVPLSPNMMNYPNAHPDWYAETLTQLLDLAANGTIQPVVSEGIPLADAAGAHELLSGSEPSSWT